MRADAGVELLPPGTAPLAPAAPGVALGVKFEGRAPASRVQQVLVVAFATAVLGIFVGVAVVGSRANGLHRPLNQCIPCGDGYNPYGGPSELCPRMCISRQLMADLGRCVRGPSEVAAALGSGAFPFPDLPGLSVPQKDVFQLLSSPALVAYFPGMLLAATAWLMALRLAPRVMVWGTIGLAVVGCAIAYHMTQNWLLLLAIVGILALSYFKKASIAKGCVSMSAALEVLGEAKYALPVLVAIELCALLLAFFIISLVVRTSQVFVLTDKCELTVANRKYQAMFASFMFLVVFNFFRMAACYTIAFAVGCWYFHAEDPAAPAAPMLTGAKQAFMSFSGTGVCVQSSVVMAIVDKLSQKVQVSETVDKLCNPLRTLAKLVVGFCLPQLSEPMMKFAIVAVALSGGSFFGTSRRAAEAIGKERTKDFVVVDRVITQALRRMAAAFSTLLALAAWATIDAEEGLGIFQALRDGTDVGFMSSKTAAYVAAFIVMAFAHFVQKPFSTLTLILLLNAFVPIEFTLVASAMAALLLGSVASLVFNYFAECAIGAQSAMFYCWCLESALLGDAEAPGAALRRDRAERAAAGWAQSKALAGSESARDAFPPALEAT